MTNIIFFKEIPQKEKFNIRFSTKNNEGWKIKKLFKENFLDCGDEFKNSYFLKEKNFSKKSNLINEKIVKLNFDYTVKINKIEIIYEKKKVKFSIEEKFQKKIKDIKKIIEKNYYNINYQSPFHNKEVALSLIFIPSNIFF